MKAQILIIRKKINRSTKTILVGFVFWILETLVFIALYGWHYNPINTVEKICDTISMTLMMYGFGCLVAELKEAVELLFKIEIQDFNNETV